jgi:hypothetical protein
MADRRFHSILTATTKVLGVASVAIAVLGAAGLLFPREVPMDDVAAVSLVAMGAGVLYLVPQQWITASRRRVILYLAATGFAPFLIFLAAVLYGLQSSAPPFRLAANLVTAGIVFLLTLCPLLSVLLAFRDQRPRAHTD